MELSPAIGPASQPHTTPSPLTHSPTHSLTHIHTDLLSACSPFSFPFDRHLSWPAITRAADEVPKTVHVAFEDIKPPSVVERKRRRKAREAKEAALAQQQMAAAQAFVGDWTVQNYDMVVAGQTRKKRDREVGNFSVSPNDCLGHEVECPSRPIALGSLPPPPFLFS